MMRYGHDLIIVVYPAIITICYGLRFNNTCVVVANDAMAGGRDVISVVELRVKYNRPFRVVNPREPPTSSWGLAWDAN